MLIRFFIPLIFLAAGFGAWRWLGIPIEEPQPQRAEPLKLKTEHLELTATNFPVILETQGSIRAHHSTTITSLVPGKILKVHPNFEDGAFFNEGDVLAELDPADLEAALTAAESRLARAEAALAQEEARAKQAKLNWDDIGYDEEPSPLVLRIPQLKEANAVISSARADVDQAQRNLDRAKIRAPFDGRVKSRMIGLGQSVGGTTALGEVFATDFAEVRLPLSANQLPFVKLPSTPDDPPVSVILTDSITETIQTDAPTWPARIVRTEGALDESSRELFAIARIDDPFGRKSGNPELRIGQPVRAAIQGITLNDVFVIPKTALRGLNRIYLIDRNNPSIQRTDIEPIWSNDEVLVVREGLKSGDWLSTTRLPYAPNGAPVEVIQPPVAAEKNQSQAISSDS